MKPKIYDANTHPHIAFPLGGIGAGMFCLQGSGAPGSFSLRNRPDVFFEPNIYAALCVKTPDGNTARVLEGQVPYHKIFGAAQDAGRGLFGKHYGLPRFENAEFSAEFPFASVALRDSSVPLDCAIEAFSPFIPQDADNSSLPCAELAYVFRNPGDAAVDAVFYFNSINFMRLTDDARVYPKENGFLLHQAATPEDASLQGDFYVRVDGPSAVVNTDWFLGGWFDTATMQWNDIKLGLVKDEKNAENHSPGGSVAVPFTLDAGETLRIPVKFTWFVPQSDLRENPQQGDDHYQPWYAGRFADAEAVMDYFTAHSAMLHTQSAAFRDAFFGADLPAEIIEAAGANLSILKSPTVLRQTDGRMWGWEGCADTHGSCHGSCTHVWNYAQAACHLFPALERSLRQTEFFEGQNEEGHQQFRANLPVSPATHSFHAASDGQLGGIMKLHREWQICGDLTWLSAFWGKAVDSVEYCIRTWDKQEEGVLREPHHNTYDIEFWGADGMCSSFYLGALKAMTLMGAALGEDTQRYAALFEKGKAYLETKLFNGEYFEQAVEWKTLEATLDLTREPPQTQALLAAEGPKYQYGSGCLSDGVLGAWMAKMCGVGETLDPEKVKSHLLAVYKYNFKRSLLGHDNPQRPGYAVGNESGLLLCSWPRGGKPSLPFVYSDEVWTGIEYQVASHLISYGFLAEGLDIVRACRARYDGTKRNPFNEYECGHWYARALASYGLIQALSKH